MDWAPKLLMHFLKSSDPKLFYKHGTLVQGSTESEEKKGRRHLCFQAAHLGYLLGPSPQEKLYKGEQEKKK